MYMARMQQHENTNWLPCMCMYVCESLKVLYRGCVQDATCLDLVSIILPLPLSSSLIAIKEDGTDNVLYVTNQKNKNKNKILGGEQTHVWQKQGDRI
eukprot:m.138175 g.138175  ORF g.138175 m.138175 type:complete len:97 (+) comp15909_c4_seq3:1695-1985(+)